MIGPPHSLFHTSRAFCSSITASGRLPRLASALSLTSTHSDTLSFLRSRVFTLWQLCYANMRITFGFAVRSFFLISSVCAFITAKDCFAFSLNCRGRSGLAERSGGSENGLIVRLIYRGRGVPFVITAGSKIKGPATLYVLSLLLVSRVDSFVLGVFSSAPLVYGRMEVGVVCFP